MLDQIQMNLLREVAELDALPVGAYNIRANGAAEARNTSANIDIVTKPDKDGIDVIIKNGTKRESVHIPVVLSEANLQESVYNDFFIGDDCDVTIIAGCGIHNCGAGDMMHDGIHSFYVGKNSKVRYIEKHYGETDGQDGRGKRIMNPTTYVEVGEGSSVTMETTQIGGVDDTIRKSKAVLEAGANLVIKDKIMTTGVQRAIADFVVDMNGEGCSCSLSSRSVAKGNSYQQFDSCMNGNAPCAGHSECDAIIMDDAHIQATPQLTATNIDAALIHEAAIGKIAGEQIIKLMTLGLSEQEAEEQIVNGFLK